MNKKSLVILAGKGISTDCLFNSLKYDYDIKAVVLESPVSKKEFLRKRIKKLGVGKVIGQVLFQLLVVKYLNLVSSKRKKEIFKYYGLDDSKIPLEKVTFLKTVNAPECITLLQKLNPELVIVNGTRIISREILNSIPVKFVNIHAGITPKYRNVHGAYWAVVNNDMANCGVTVHLVDTGIDTGNILCQKNINITQKDNFATYPLLQLAEGIGCLKEILPSVFENTMIYQKGTAESKVWYHPTLWQYLFQRLFHGKK